MQQILDLDMVIKHIDILEKVFDRVRLVNPVIKRVLSVDDKGVAETAQTCFDVWEHRKVCDSCISMRAIREKNIFFKLEYSSGRICMVMAIPVFCGNDLYALELVKDVTTSLIVQNLPTEENHEILKTLHHMTRLQIRDGLTDLYNRRYIDERLPVDMMNTQAGGSPLSIILLDIDHFKKVNDSYGHIAGDHVLKDLAGILLEHVEGLNGWAARYGGEEFLISLIGVDHHNARGIAEYIRSVIESSEIQYDGKTIKITASFGVGTIENDSGITAEAFMESVDKKLYQAKNNGRNRVEGD